VEPGGQLDFAPPVLRIHLEQPEGMQLPPAALQLFEGELSAYHQGRVMREDLPSTLIERLVPSQSWFEPKEAGWVVAPSVPLEPGGQYSLAATSVGLVGTVTVRAQGLPRYLARLWPPAEGDCGAQYAVYCADRSAPGDVSSGPLVVGSNATARLSPGEVAAQLAPGANRRGVASARCVHLTASDPLPAGAALVPPPLVESVALDPAPLIHAPREPVAPLECGEGQARFARGCAEIEDDRLALHSPDYLTLWVVVGAADPVVEVLPPQTRLVIRGLAPASSQRLDVSVVDPTGELEQFTERVTTVAQRPHLVLSEVLADPIGPEPAQEWVELFNDGRGPVDLEGWLLEDIGGQTSIPAHVLEPREYALIVPEGYVPESDVDVPPAVGTVLLRVPELGSSGLLNSGERLLLRAPDGDVASRFPAIKPKPGVSVARHRPWSLDDDEGAFALHQEPGASPGAENRLR
jgi:hypothetical protein